MNRIRSVPGEGTGPSPIGKALVLVLPGLWTSSVVAMAFVLPGRVHVVQLLAAAPAIACAGSGRRWCVLVGGACALIALLPLSDTHRPGGYQSELGHVLAILSVIVASYLITGRRLRLTRELARAREVADAAQRVLLRPPPPRIADLAVAGDYLSASRGARIGGDLYGVLGTPHGVRVIIGDVRGHGLAAVGTVAALLGCFREAAHDESELDGVLRRLDRALARHLAEDAGAADPATGTPRPDGPATEEFATVLLLQLEPDGGLSMLNCGHPWPYLIDTTPESVPWVRPLTTVEPMPPLGVLDAVSGAPARHRAQLRPGRTLLLYTDGAEEARDATGAFFALTQSLGTAARRATRDGVLDPDVLISATRAALMAHVAGRLSDDVALLALARDPAVPPTPGPDDRSRRRPVTGVRPRHRRRPAVPRGGQRPA